jgi:hypothetical protein
VRLKAAFKKKLLEAGSKAMKKPCRHNKSWFVQDGRIEWCYECGAFREMTRLKCSNIITPITPWVKPVGKGGENPFEAWIKRTEVYQNKKQSW